MPGIGPWLKPFMDFQGWTDPRLAAEVVKEVLKTFDRLLAQIAQQNKNVIYVRTQGTLNSRSQWDNELHPTEAGSGKSPKKFHDALQAHFPDASSLLEAPLRGG